MENKIRELKTKIAPLLRIWWLSLVLLPFSWVLAKQYWMALSWDISYAWLYKHPALLSPFIFLTDNFLLIVHEAGHTILGIFGWRTLTILGGTLFEIGLPLLIFYYGWKNRHPLVAQLGLILTAFAWLGSAAYAADALERRLPLIGNLPKAAHDFYNLFLMYGIMDWYMTLAWLMYGCGFLCLVLCLCWPLITPKKVKTIDLELDL